MSPDKIIDAARSLTPSKFLLWCEDQGLAVEILNRDDVFNVNSDPTTIKVNDLELKFVNGTLIQ